MAGWTTPAIVRAADARLREAHGWDDGRVQAIVNRATRTMKRWLRPRWSTYLTAATWLENEPLSVPEELCDLCLELAIVECYLSFYSDPDSIAEAYARRADIKREVVGANIGKPGEVRGLNQTLQIMGRDGVLCTGSRDTIATIAYETKGADDPYHTLGSDDIDGMIDV